jgi:hypothetical protein
MITDRKNLLVWMLFMIPPINMPKLIISTIVLASLAVFPVVSVVNAAPGKQVTVGSVETVSDTKLMLTNPRTQKTSEVTLNSAIRVLGKDNRLLNIKSLKAKDMLAVLEEDATGEGKFKVKKIFVKDASASALSKRRAVMGVIASINGNTIVLRHQTQTDRTFTVITTANTQVRGKVSETDSSPSATLATLAVGQRIMAIGHQTDAGLEAKHIHIIPGKAAGLLKRQPTGAVPTVTITSTPSGTISPTVVPTVTVSTTPVATNTPTTAPTVAPTP